MTATAPERAAAGEVADQVRAALRRTFLAAQADNPHDPVELSMSGLGGCTRRAAYQVAGTPPSDTPPAEEGRAAMLGEWIHHGMLPRLAVELGMELAEVEVEKRVILRAGGLLIPGRADLAGGLVLDLKTVTEGRLYGVRRLGEYYDHRIQVLGYALACHQAGYPVRYVAWLYIDRSSGDSEVVVEPFTNAAAMTVIRRVQEIRAYADQDPDEAPRDERGPGLSFACDRCPWLRRCWGEDAVSGETGAQRILAADVPGTERAALLLSDARRRKAAADRDEKFAKAILESTPSGTYGSAELYRQPGQMVADNEDIREGYERRGEEYPMQRAHPVLKVRVLSAAESSGGTPWRPRTHRWPGQLAGPPVMKTHESGPCPG